MDDGDEGWRRVGAGLRLVLIGLMTLVILLVTSTAVAVVLGKPTKDPREILDALNRDHPMTMTVLTGVGVLARVLGIAGKALCLSVPAAAGATAFIVMALACDVTSLAMDIVARAAPVGDPQADLAQIGILAWLFGYFAFIRFLRRMAEYLRAPRQAEWGRRLLVGSSALFFVTFLAVLGKAGGGGDGLLLMAGLLLVIGVPVLFVLYARLVHDIRRAAEAAADKLSEEF